MIISLTRKALIEPFSVKLPYFYHLHTQTHSFNSDFLKYAIKFPLHLKACPMGLTHIYTTVAMTIETPQGFSNLYSDKLV